MLKFEIELGFEEWAYDGKVVLNVHQDQYGLTIEQAKALKKELKTAIAKAEESGN